MKIYWTFLLLLKHSLQCLVLSSVIITPLFADFVSDPVGNSTPSVFVTGDVNTKIIASYLWGGFWLSENHGESWIPINSGFEQLPNPNISRIVTATSQLDTLTAMALHDPPTLYISTDSGHTWDNITDTRMNEDMWTTELPSTFHPSDASTIFCASSAHLFVSQNAGETWERYGPVDTTSYSKRNVLYDERSNRIFLTGFYIREQSGYDYGGVLVSAPNNFNEWTECLNMYEQFGVSMASVWSITVLSNNDWLVCVPDVYDEGDDWFIDPLAVSSDDGETWQRAGTGLPPYYHPLKVIEDTSHQGKLFICGTSYYGLYTSDDYGRTWQRCLSGLPENASMINDISFDSENNVIFASVDGFGLFESVDSGASWQSVAQPPIGSKGHLSIFEETIWYRDTGYRLWYNNENAETWDEVLYPVYQDTITMFRPIIYQNEACLVSGVWLRPFNDSDAYFRMAYSNNFGIDWIYSEQLPFLPSGSYERFCIHDCSDFVRMTTPNKNQDSLFISTDFGESWQSYGLPFFFRDYQQNDSMFFFTDLNNLYISDSSLTSYETISSPENMIIKLFTELDGNVFLSCNQQQQNIGFYSYRWEDDRWELRSTLEGGSRLFEIVRLPNDTIFISADINFSHFDISYDLGYTWSEHPAEFPWPNQTWSFTDLEYDPWRGRLWASTGAGLCYLTIDQLNSVDGPLQFQPSDPYLLSVYPNPFNSSIRIQFTLTSPGPVRLELFNIEGRLVRTMLDEQRQPGCYTIPAELNSLASGVYFLRLDSNQHTNTKRIVLLH